jgi:hypothetical protein
MGNTPPASAGDFLNSRDLLNASAVSHDGEGQLFIGLFTDCADFATIAEKLGLKVKPVDHLYKEKEARARAGNVPAIKWLLEMLPQRFESQLVLDENEGLQKAIRASRSRAQLISAVSAISVKLGQLLDSLFDKNQLVALFPCTPDREQPGVRCVFCHDRHPFHLPTGRTSSKAKAKLPSLQVVRGVRLLKFKKCCQAMVNKGLIQPAEWAALFGYTIGVRALSTSTASTKAQGATAADAADAHLRGPREAFTSEYYPLNHCRKKMIRGGLKAAAASTPQFDWYGFIAAHLFSAVLGLLVDPYLVLLVPAAATHPEKPWYLVGSGRGEWEGSAAARDWDKAIMEGVRPPCEGACCRGAAGPLVPGPGLPSCRALPEEQPTPDLKVRAAAAGLAGCNVWLGPGDAEPHLASLGGHPREPLIPVRGVVWVCVCVWVPFSLSGRLSH